MTDTISVIVPVYNVEKYLHRCIDSIIHQTYQNLEIILIDDGSPDNCGNICDEYAHKDRRIKVVHKENGGLSDARNVGIENATGMYLAFLDSDDWVHNTYIEVLYNLLTNYEADISVCNFYKVSSSDNLSGLSQNSHGIITYTNLEALHQLYDENYLQMIVAWGKLFNKKLFEGIIFPVGKIHEDEFLVYKVLYRASKIVYTSEQLVFYFQRPESIVGEGFKLKNRLDALEAHEERNQFYREIGANNLVAKNCYRIFSIYKSIFHHIHTFPNQASQNDFLNRYELFKKEMRETSQSLSNKLNYELYFHVPILYRFISRYFIHRKW